MSTLEKRYSEAIRRLSHEYLLGLPEDIKAKLQETTDLKELVELLEALVSEKEGLHLT